MGRNYLFIPKFQTVQTLKFGIGWLFSSHTLLGMQLLIYARIKVNHVNKMGRSNADCLFLIPNELYHMARPILFSSQGKHRHCMAVKLPANIPVFKNALDQYLKEREMPSRLADKY